MNKKSRRGKWSPCSYTVYSVSQIERNSRDETVERAPLQDRSRSGCLCGLDIGVDASPERRDHAQHPDRRCEQDSTEDCCSSKPEQTGSCDRPTSEMIKCPEPHRPVKSLKLQHQTTSIKSQSASAYPRPAVAVRQDSYPGNVLKASLAVSVWDTLASSCTSSSQLRKFSAAAPLRPLECNKYAREAKPRRSFTDPFYGLANFPRKTVQFCARRRDRHGVKTQHRQQCASQCKRAQKPILELRVPCSNR